MCASVDNACIPVYIRACARFPALCNLSPKNFAGFSMHKSIIYGFFIE